MAEMLLINPKRRTHKRRANPMHHAKRRVHHTRRKANPYAAMLTHARRRKHHARKHNPIHAMRRRVMRRRNPIGGGMMTGYMSLIKDGLIGGAGALAIASCTDQTCRRAIHSSVAKTCELYQHCG